jgi:hypothetical protein
VGGQLLLAGRRLYESYGAMKLRDAPLCLVLPLETVATALRAANKL